LLWNEQTAECPLLKAEKNKITADQIAQEKSNGGSPPPTVSFKAQIPSFLNLYFLVHGLWLSFGIIVLVCILVKVWRSLQFSTEFRSKEVRLRKAFLGLRLKLKNEYRQPQHTRQHTKS
jgi:hypothetical protein